MPVAALTYDIIGAHALQVALIFRPDFVWALNGPLPPQNPLEKVGHIESSKTYPYPRGPGRNSSIFGGLNGLLLPQNPLEKVGGLAPNIFQWASR